MPRYKLRTLMIVLALVAVLVTIGIVEWHDEGVGQAVKALHNIAPATEQHSNEINELTAP